MNAKEFDQIKSYVTLIVAELHKNIFDDAVFDRLKATLHLAEEAEVMLMNVERSQERGSNVIQLYRIA